MSRPTAGPSYEEAIAFYLRPDICDVLWGLSNRRALRFYYHSDVDFVSHGVKASAVTIHCPRTRKDFCDAVSEAAGRRQQPDVQFHPFFGMHHAVNSPGRPDDLTGWDMRFEADLELRESLDALIPVLAVLEHYRVPVISKFSGHRSLHVIIPAEAFPGEMKRRPLHKEWMAAFDKIGEFLCRMAPALTTTGAKLAKAFVLTTPYSFHRYHGLLSIPVTLTQAFDFDPDTARLDRFAGVSWQPEQLDRDADAMGRLMSDAGRVSEDPQAVFAVAEKIFRGDRWKSLAERSVPEEFCREGALGVLAAGMPAINCLSDEDCRAYPRRRLRLALAAVDRPEAKTSRFLRLIAGRGFDHPVMTMQDRSPACHVIATWVEEGLERSIELLMNVASNREFAVPVTLAVRIASLLPEPPEAICAALEGHPAKVRAGPSPEGLFLVLALAELAWACPQALDSLGAPEMTPRQQALRSRLCQAGEWKVEERPDLAVAALVLAFGRDSVTAWERPPAGSGIDDVIGWVFGSERKFKHALKSLESGNARGEKKAGPRGE